MDILAEVNGHGVIVPPKRRSYLMQHVFTFEQNCTSEPRSDIYDTMDVRPVRVQAKLSHLRIRLRLNLV